MGLARGPHGPPRHALHQRSGNAAHPEHGRRISDSGVCAQHDARGGLPKDIASRRTWGRGGRTTARDLTEPRWRLSAPRPRTSPPHVRLPPPVPDSWTLARCRGLARVVGNAGDGGAHGCGESPRERRVHSHAAYGRGVLSQAVQVCQARLRGRAVRGRRQSHAGADAGRVEGAATCAEGVGVSLGQREGGRVGGNACDPSPRGTSRHLSSSHVAVRLDR